MRKFLFLAVLLLVFLPVLFSETYLVNYPAYNLYYYPSASYAAVQAPVYQTVYLSAVPNECILYYHSFQNPLDNWIFKRGQTSSAWTREESYGMTVLHLQQQGTGSSIAEKIIPIPPELRGRTLNISAVVMVQIDYQGCLSNSEYSAAGMYSRVYPIGGYLPFTGMAPATGKVRLWGTSQYPVKVSPYFFRDEFFKFLGLPECVFLVINTSICPPETCYMENLVVGFFAINNTICCPASSDIWISELKVTYN